MKILKIFLVLFGFILFSNYALFLQEEGESEVATTEEAGIDDTGSEETVEAGGNVSELLQKIAQSTLPFKDKLALFEQGIDSIIVLTTPYEEKRAFVTAFNDFVSVALTSTAITIKELDNLYSLFEKIRTSTKLSSGQRAMLKSSRGWSIGRRRDLQIKFQARLNEIAEQSFDRKISSYKAVFSTELNANINDQNRQNLENALSNLVSIANEKGALAQDKVKEFFNEIKDNQFLSDAQKNQINNYISQLGGIAAVEVAPTMDVGEVFGAGVPAEEVPAEEVPAEGVQAEEVPAEDVPAEGVQAEEVPAEDIPAEGASREGVQAEGASSQDLTKKLSEIESTQKVLKKIEGCNTALPMITQATPQGQKGRLLQIMVNLFNSRGDLTKEELDALKNLFQAANEHTSFLNEEQKKVMSVWLNEVAAAFNVTQPAKEEKDARGQMRLVHSTYLQSLPESAEGKPYLERVKIYDRVLNLLTPLTLTWEKRRFIRRALDLYNKRGGKNYDELKALGDFLEKCAQNKFLTDHLPTKFSEYMQNVKVTYLFKEVEQKDKYLEKIQICKNVVDQLNDDTAKYELSLAYGCLERLFNYRTTLENVYNYWVRIRKYKKELKQLEEEIATLKALGELFGSVESKIKLFKRSESQDLEQWKNIINGAIILAAINEEQELMMVITECDKVLDLLDHSGIEKERDLFFEISQSLMRKRGNMTKEVLSSLQSLFDKAVDKRYILTTAQKAKLNNNIKELKEAKKTTKDTDYLTSLLDMAAKEKKWDEAFDAFVKGFELFKNTPTKEITAKFVAVFNNIWPNRPKDEKIKIRQLRKVFEQINERDDILQSRAQRTTMQNWLEVLSREG